MGRSRVAQESCSSCFNGAAGVCPRMVKIKRRKIWNVTCFNGAAGVCPRMDSA